MLKPLGPFLLSLLVTAGAVPVSANQAAAENAPLIDFRSRFVPEGAEGAMVVGPERLASEAGLAMLAKGGNAVDAAVATGFALAVTLPRAGNIGGGGFMLIHMAEQDRNVFIDYRETAPAAATRDMFLTPEGTVDKRRAYFSHQASGVPGTVAGLIHALENYGSLPLATVLQPAIELARDGFTMDLTLHKNLAAREERLAMNPETARIFLRDGKAPPIGGRFKQPDLAVTLQRIAEQGKDGFYRGRTAELIAADMAANGGLITAADLATYQAIEREPVTGRFRDYEIVSAPPPSSGGIHIIQMLNILEPYPLNEWGHNSARYLHHVIEAMKLAFADRSEHLGDPERMTAPIPLLIDKAYAAQRRQLINPKMATPSSAISAGTMPPPESPDTTHYSVTDSDGNVVSNTYTLNFSFGSHITVPGTGILMNNEMDDFAAQPGTANAFGLVQGEVNSVSAGRRPLSSMTPTLVFREGEPWLATGSPGGSLIITTVLQTVLNAMAFDMNIAEAAAAPRVHHQWLPDRVLTEPGISPDTLDLLESMGHNVEATRRTLGRTNSIQLEGSWRYGYSDLRRPGGFVARPIP